MKRLHLITIVIVVGLLVLVGATTLFAQSGNQWRMDFYPNLDWAGAPVYTQYSTNLNYDWGANSPGPNISAANWTMRATSNTFFYAGMYRFNILADDEVVLIIDNVVYLDTRGKGQTGKNQVVDIPMTQGNHNLEVDYRQYTGPGYLYVSWGYFKPGGGTPVPTPGKPLPAPLPPASATSVQTKYGDFTPCIQQNLQQANCFHSDGAWNSPNVGSIQMEPKITVWGNCEPADQDVTWTVDPNSDPIKTHQFRCSKTLAGWFPE